MQLFEKTALLESLAADAFVHAIEIAALVEIVEAGNDPAVIDGINAAQAGSAARRIRDSVFVYLHMIVSRSYAKPRLGDQHLRQAFELVKNPEVREAVDAMCNAERLADAIDLWKKCCSDHRLQAYLHYRDKFIAHLGQPDAAIPKPRYNEALEIARSTAAVMEALAQAIGVTSMSVSDHTPRHKESARCFWAQFLDSIPK